MNNIKNFTATLAMGISLLTLSACEQNTTEYLQVTPSTSLPFKGEYAVQISNDKWLHYGPDHGLFVSNRNGKIEFESSLALEYLDRRTQGDREIIFAMSKDGVPTFIQYQNGLTIKQGAAFSLPIEGACLFQPKGEPLQAFLLDETGIGHQVVIKEAADQIQLIPLRTFPLPPASEYCAVHDDSEQLFVSEESVGVWKYPARAESEISREVVALVAPHGPLANAAGPLAIVNNTLIMAEVGSPRLHTVSLNENGFSLGSRYELDGNTKVDTLTLSTVTATEIQLTALDDGSARLIAFSIPQTTRAQSLPSIANVPADVETTPVVNQGDAADDPAIWVHPTQPDNSRILGTNKKRGLYVYDLSGHQLQELLVDRVNNVDVRQGFTHKGKAADIAAASQRDRHAIALFHIDPSSGLVSIANEIETTLDDVYGLCMYKGNEDKVYVFINDEDGRFEQWQIEDSPQGWSGKKVREFAVASQPEGCAADDRAQQLFLGEEDVAVWTVGAEPNDGSSLISVAQVGDILVADIEGMDVYQGNKGSWLIVSSQGNDSYAIFDAKPPFTYQGRFRIGLNADKGIDGASETDGLTVTSANLGPQFPHGLLVVQDGRNLFPMETQNFKLVSWEKISTILPQAQ